MSHPKNVTVLGLGYVGCVTAACLADLGHRVTGVERDQLKVNDIMSGRAPFYEPGLNQIVETNVCAGRLSATTLASEALLDADVALVCVGTPSERNGNISLDQLRRVTKEVADAARQRKNHLILAIRSTVLPGTCDNVVTPEFTSCDIGIVSNPEFLREGSAVKDFREPSLLVVGGSRDEDVETVCDLYNGLGVPACKVTLRVAEMIKYASNAFHAIKISFANEIGTLSAALGVNGQVVMETLCKDTRLNTSSAYLRPGFAFGGSCLPKDLRAITYKSSHLDLKLPLLEAALPSNDTHLARAIQTVLELNADRIGILGLAFKEDTDDVRESPVVRLLEALIGKGRNLRIYDPHIQISNIYGSNREYIVRAIPHIGRLLEQHVDGVLHWAQHLIVTQKPSPELSDKIAHSKLPITDLVGCGLETAVFECSVAAAVA